MGNDFVTQEYYVNIYLKIIEQVSFKIIFDMVKIFKKLFYFSSFTSVKLKISLKLNK